MQRIGGRPDGVKRTSPGEPPHRPVTGACAAQTSRSRPGRARARHEPCLTGPSPPRTVEAYRRDLTALAGFLGKPVADATVEDLERYTAQLRADGLSPATIARRAAAARSFFRHQQLLGARDDNPAAAVRLPRRGRT